MKVFLEQLVCFSVCLFASLVGFCCVNMSVPEFPSIHLSVVFCVSVFYIQLSRCHNLKQILNSWFFSLLVPNFLNIYTVSKAL